MAFTKEQLDAYIQALYDDDGQLSSADYQLIINYILSNGEPETDPRDLIQIRRGDEADLPTLAQGEMGYTLDTNNLFIGGLNGNVKIGEVPVIANYLNLVQNFGTDSEDWTTAIQTALNENKIVTLPLEIPGMYQNGIYRVSGTITLNQNNNLVGEGTPPRKNKDNTFTKNVEIYHVPTTPTDLFKINQTSLLETYVDGVQIKNLFIQGNGNSRLCMDMQSLSRGLIENIAFEGFDEGIKINYNLITQYQNIYMLGCTNYGIKFTGGLTTTTHLDNVWMLGCTTGVIMEEASVLNSFLNGVTIEGGLTAYDIYTENVVNISNVHIENTPEDNSLNSTVKIGVNGTPASPANTLVTFDGGMIAGFNGSWNVDSVLIETDNVQMLRLSSLLLTRAGRALKTTFNTERVVVDGVRELNAPLLTGDVVNINAIKNSDNTYLVGDSTQRPDPTTLGTVSGRLFSDTTLKTVLQYDAPFQTWRNIVTGDPVV